MPAYTIAHNAGVEGAVVVGKLLEQTNLSIGYDAAKGLSYFLFSWAFFYIVLDPMSRVYLEWRGISTEL
jgi:chaperonin GroEL (HSP60 family)